MSLDESLLRKLHQLPPDKQLEVLDFVEFLYKKSVTQPTPRRSVKGAWSDLGSQITEDDIAEVRLEMWRNFPHEDI